jgi:two-component system, chemotaxis family, sensor histidine kinase and response regulator PixL
MYTVDAELRDQAYQFFKQEAIDLLQVLEAGLLNLPNDRSLTSLHHLMRAAHSIKGGAGTVGLDGIQRIAHRLEDVFRSLYHWQDEISPELEGLLLEAYDGLRVPLMMQVQTGHYDKASAWETVEPSFEQLIAILGEASAIAPLSTAELGIDVVQEVFAGDVEQGLVHLEAVLQDLDSPLLLGELRAQAEVFVGTGELLELPGFTQIAQALMTGLNHHPEQAPAIGIQALADLRLAQTAVLAGDRHQGGSPSPALLAFAKEDSTQVADLWDGLLGSDAEQVEHLSNQFSDDLTSAFFMDPADSFSDDLPSDVWDDLSQNLNEDLFSDSHSDLTDDVQIDEVNTLQSDLISDLQSDEVNALQDDLTSDSQTDVTRDLQTASPEDREMMPLIPDRRSNRVDRRQTADKVDESTPALSPMVRVDLQRLERLNNLVGEMVTQENTVLLYNQQLQGSIKRLQQRFETFERLTKLLQTRMDRSQNVGMRSPQSGSLATSPIATSSIASAAKPSAESVSLSVNFDALQMDEYSDLHQIMQEAVDEIAHMGETMRDMNLITQQAQQNQRIKQQTIKQVRNDLLWARMMPLGDILQRFPRMMHDLAIQYDKQIDFRIVGGNTLVDKAVLEKLFDPLVHLVRNAFDHGAETPAERLSQGKPAKATIEIRAYHRGNQTLIEVWDDGRGVNLAQVKAAAIDRHLLTATEAETVSSEQLYGYLFTPDFSTKTTTSELSGRGVGLSTVQEQVKQLKGTLSLSSQLGKETRFTIRIPLTLTIAKLLVFSVDDKFMAITVDTLLGIVMADETALPTIQGQRYYREGDEMVPLFPTSTFAHRYPLPQPSENRLRPIPLPRNGKIPVLLIADGETLIALEVDQILNEQELVIKPFGGLFQPPPYLYGCTVLADGTLVPVVDGAVLVHHQAANSRSPLPELPQKSLQKPSDALPNVATILVIDDALTARQTLSLTLQKAGYQVIQATDGREALEKLRQATVPIRAVFCDVEMPNMNGFEFLTTCRRSFTSQTLPIIMLTSRSSEKHQGIAKMLGANRYLTKPYLEREVLQTLQDCLAAVEADPIQPNALSERIDRTLCY